MEVAPALSFLGLSLLDWTAIAAIATVLLALGAGFTVYYARKAFREQAKELSALQRQAEGTTKLIEIQSGQLDAQRDQFEAQKEVNAKQTTVLELQARELQESLDERKRAAEDQRREQANQVAAWFGPAEFSATVGGIVGEGLSNDATAHYWGAFIRNESALPVFSVRVFFEYIAADSPASEAWQPVRRGGPINRIRVLPPRTVRFVQIPPEIKNMIEQCNEDIYTVSLEFTDVAGNRWERDARGALTER